MVRSRLVASWMALLALLISLVSAPLASATTTSLESITPNSWGVLDVKLSAGIKEKLDALLDQAAASMGGDQTGDVLLQVLRSGERVLAAGAMTEGGPYGFLALPATDTQWQAFSADTTQEDDIYTAQDGALSFSRLGNFIAASNMVSVIQNSIDLSKDTKTNSLENDEIYNIVKNKLLSNRFVGLYVNVPGLIADVEEQDIGDQEEFDAMKAFLKLYEAIGLSVGEVDNGYKFNIVVQGNAAEVARKGYSFNPGGNFVPSLYKKFPDAKPILYTEGYNPKAGWDISQNLLDDISESLGEENPFDEAFAEIKEETGFDIPSVYNTFEKEFAYAVQYDTKKPLPYLTVLGNVSGNRAAGVSLATSLRSLITKVLDELPSKTYIITSEGDITKIRVDFKKLDDFEGPPFPTIVFTLGVTDDDLFIFSNYPGAEKSEVRTGFGADADFSAAYQNKEEAVTNLLYMNVRNFWGFLDHFTAWGESITDGEHGPPLDFYQGYYSVLEKIYAWKDFLLVTRGTATQADVEGTIILDKATHKSYEELMSELKAKDTDNDGVSDFEERYIYQTPVANGDSDGDGVNDFEELEKGENPDGEGQLFKDVNEGDWYADEVGQTWNSGVVKGYDDQTFKPGRLVTRAEFVAMAVRAFEQDTSKFLGLEVELTKGVNPFADVASDAWYVDGVSKAYSQKWIKGKVDPATGLRTFRPGDPITRAEAVQILNQASGALQKSQGVMTKPLPFKDVSQDQWFYGSVSNAYANDITQGKRPDEFQPLANVSRAEAAALIFRTMNFETNATAEKAELDLNLPTAGLPLFGGQTVPLEKTSPPIEAPEKPTTPLAEPLSSSSENVTSASTTLNASVDHHSLGSANAPIVMEEFSDFQCPFCGQFFKNTFPDIKTNYINTGKVRLVYKHFPLGSHAQAQKAAEASECAGEQGKFWGMHDKLFNRYSEWAGSDAAVSIFKSYAKALNLNTTQFNFCLDSSKYYNHVQADLTEGIQKGITGTPGFFINDQPLMGAQPYLQFKQIFDSILNTLAFTG